MLHHLRAVAPVDTNNDTAAVQPTNVENSTADNTTQQVAPTAAAVPSTITGNGDATAVTPGSCASAGS